MALSCAASMSRKDCCQPGLSAGTSTILRSWSDVAVGQVQQRVDVGDAELVATAAGPHDLVAGLDAGLR